MSSIDKLQGKHALVTGGAQGIGWAIAQALLVQGMRVSISGRDTTRLQQAQAGYAGENLFALQMDVASAASVDQGFCAAEKQFGTVDVLINNAGQVVSAPFLKTSAGLWQQMLDVNLTGSFHCMQRALPAMRTAGWGRIVNVASTAGLQAYPYVAAYVAAKHGLIGLTRALALEVAAQGITVNAVCPGYTETAIVEQAVTTIAAKTGCSAEQARATLTAANPQRRLIQVEEVANAVVWLCQPASAAMNGQAIAVAGGEVM